MPRLRNSLSAALAGAVLLAGCEAAPATSVAADRAAPRPTLGLLTGLPLYHPLDADIGAIVSGAAPVPWQRQALERDYVLAPLDTLAPIPALSPGGAARDPLAGLTRLAVIQPRGLSPADNVAVDRWVRGGGHLLLVLDPMLTGAYPLPLTDPRHPPASALIPPVVARWGMAVRFDEAQSADVRERALAGAALPLALAGEVTIAEGACTQAAEGAAAMCRVGSGKVTLIADAALFEHCEIAGEDAATLRTVVRAGLE
jgi:hypothetical protein